MGMVAAKAHQKGSTKSANRPSTVKTIQNIFFCIEGIVRCWAAGGCGKLSSFARLDSRGRLSPHKANRTAEAAVATRADYLDCVWRGVKN